jgi:hypothetical protein
MRDRSPDTPMDLPQLRFWLARLASDYEKILTERNPPLTKRQKKDHRKALASVKQTCEGNENGQGRTRVRELIAAGAISYGLSRHKPPDELIPEQLIIDFAVFALWPLVIVPKLPSNYFDDLRIVSSEPLARLVTHARLSRMTKSPMSAEDFSRALANSNVAAGVRNLLNDLADPQRGGCAFTAISIASTGTVPHGRTSPKVIAMWVLAAAGAGIIGNSADDAVTKAWDWLDNADNHTIPQGGTHAAHHSSSSSEPQDQHHPGHQDHHHQSHNNRGGDGLLNVIENIIQDLF